MISYTWFIVPLCILFGIFNSTNIQVVWGQPAMGVSALVAGIICCIKGRP